MEKIFFVLGVGFSLCDIIMGTGFCPVAEFTWSWGPTQWAIFLAQIVFGI